MARGTILFLGGLLALLAAFAFKQVLIAPPPVPEAAEPGTFDANRAFARLERILAGEEPHPVDSPASDGLRERLMAEMRAVGLEPRVSDAMTCATIRAGRNVNCARVRNIVATIGPADGEHLLLVAHYDSVPVGPGAADDGVGIAAMLEVAEQLRGQELRRPITFLFNESEETGLLGARSFLDRDPVASRVTTLLNLEARGVDGPAVMFETSRPNAPAVSFYGGSAERPVANSLSTDFYRMLPNSTDVTVFDERPWTILNIAIIGNETRYHSAGDNLAALDRRSLQHMGGQALGVARHHASGALADGAGELIYTDVLGRHLVTLPLVVGLVLLGAIVLLLGYALVRRWAFGSALLAAFGAVAGSGLLAWLLTTIVQWLRPGEFWRAYPIAMQVAVAASALLAIVVALSLARTRSREQLRTAAWFLFVLAGAAICIFAPGAAIYFLLAPLILLAGILAGRWISGAERIAGWTAGLVQLLTFLPILALADLVLSTSPGWIAAPIIALAALPLLVELWPDAPPGRSGWRAAGALAAAAWVAVLLVPAASEDRQRIFTIEYVRDLSRGAEWGIYNDGAPVPDAYDEIGEWRREQVPYASRQRWLTAAPVVEQPTPRLVKLGEAPVAGGRRVTLRAEMNGWDRFELVLPAESRPLSMRAGAAEAAFGDGKGDGRGTVRCVGRSCEGFTFDLVLGASGPVDATLIGNVARLPAEAEMLVRGRPSLARPQYVPDASYVLAPVGL